MDELWAIVAELSVDLSPARVQSAASVVAQLDGVENVSVARGAFGPNLASGLWQRFQKAWEECPKATPREVAAALQAGSRVGQLMDGGQAVDLVWTGPNTAFVPVRSTEQVMLEVIQRAKKRLFLVSFVNFGARTIVDALNEAADRGVAIRMLLEESKGAAAKLKAAVPTAVVFVWDQQAKAEAGSPSSASVHAKCVVADSDEALITSANLTDHALERNMELGVHIIGGREPKMLSDHLGALVSTASIDDSDHAHRLSHKRWFTQPNYHPRNRNLSRGLQGPSKLEGPNSSGASLGVTLQE